MNPQSLGKRILLAALIVILILMAVNHFVGDQADAQDPPISKYEKRLLELDRLAMEEAYKQHIQHLYAVWMADPKAGGPRAATGARSGREGFSRAMDAIERREQQLKQATPAAPPPR